VGPQRLPPEIEASACFIAAEALTNVVKHAQAARAEDRVAALGGRFEIASPAGGGPRVAATLPLAPAAFADRR
jgi:signal transduction histidine kinase